MPGGRGGRLTLAVRTAEDIISSNTVSDRRIPKVVTLSCCLHLTVSPQIITGNDGGRKFVPSFAGNINIGPVGRTDLATFCSAISNVRGGRQASCFSNHS